MFYFAIIQAMVLNIKCGAKYGNEATFGSIKLYENVVVGKEYTVKQKRADGLGWIRVNWKVIPDVANRFGIKVTYFLGKTETTIKPITQHTYFLEERYYEAWKKWAYTTKTSHQSPGPAGTKYFCV